jgi:hypothetical protein
LTILALTYRFYDRPNLQHKDYNGEVAVLDYILSTGRCPTDSAGIYYLRKSARESQWFRWQDTVKDSLATPLDTSAVTLDSLGLNYVLSAAPTAVATGPDPIMSFAALRNPAHGEFVLQLELGAPAAIDVEVFDVLGHRLWHAGRQSIDRGMRSFNVTLDDAGGTYFARVSTASGATRTIRLVMS